MSKEAKHSGVYEKLVVDDHDFLGQVAYCIYKNRKREFIIRKKFELHLDILSDDIISEFVKDQTDYTLELYKDEARKLSREFLDASYEVELKEAKQALDTEYKKKYEELARNIKPHSWWYGVFQSLAASLIFFATGILLLLSTGGWSRVGKALMQLAQ